MRNSGTHINNVVHTTYMSSFVSGNKVYNFFSFDIRRASSKSPFIVWLMIHTHITHMRICILKMILNLIPCSLIFGAGFNWFDGIEIHGEDCVGGVGVRVIGFCIRKRVCFSKINIWGERNFLNQIWYVFMYVMCSVLYI